MENPILGGSEWVVKDCRRVIQGRSRISIGRTAARRASQGRMLQEPFSPSLALQASIEHQSFA
ncbi:MAG: hypothetical protein ACREIV_13490, partial [Planctomycetaceae bacterium]